LRPGARFGSQLSLDSELLVVIASQEAHDENAPAMAIMYGGDYGVAYIFHRQGDQWRQQARLAPTSQDPENNPVRLVSAALDGGARGGARLALTGYGREVYYPYLLKDQEWQALDSVTAGEMYFLGEGQAITFSANTVLLGNRFFPRYNPNDMSEPQLDAAGAIIPIDWPE
jgi:hypothetical protein